MKKLKNKMKIKEMERVKKVVLVKRKAKSEKRKKVEKERNRILNSFYTKEIKKGKSIRAYYFDTMFLMISTLIFIIIIINKLINNFIISLLIGTIIIAFMLKYPRERIKKQRKLKIEEVKKEYKIKLEEEGLIRPEEDIEDYIVKRYYENKKEIKDNINFTGKDKVIKLYFLFGLFYIGSYFVSYPIYYKVVSIIIFIAATFIGSYNLIELIRERDDEDLINDSFEV